MGILEVFASIINHNVNIATFIKLKSE